MSDRRAAAHRDWLARLGLLAAARVQRLWDDRVDPGDVRGSWTAALPGAVLVVRAAVTVAVEAAQPYVAGMVADAGRDPAPRATLRVEPFTSEVTPRLMASPAVRALTRIGDGQPPAQALASGRWLAGAVTRDTTADAGRDAVTAAMAAEPSVRGYVRVPSMPCCGRCAILAGRVYKVDGFARHPRCDCGMQPLVAGQPQPRVVDPGDYFRSLTEPQQNRLFGADVADRIRHGDGSPRSIGRAVNADRSMWRRRRVTPTVTDLTDRAPSWRHLFDDLADRGFLAA